MLCPYEERIIASSTVDVLKRPAVLGSHQDDFDAEKTFIYKEIFVEDRLHGVVNMNPSSPFNSNYNKLPSVPPHGTELSSAYGKKCRSLERQSYYEEEIDMPLFSNRSVCDNCLKQKSLESPANKLCFECDRYMCETCDCEHSDSFRMDSTKTREEIDRVVVNVLDSIMHNDDIGKELNEIKVDIAQKICVKHNLDESDCYVTGLCALEDGRVVVIDHLNSCIKVYRHSVLHQYLKLSTKPFDVTEITDGSRTDSQSADVYLTGEKCKLAITCPAAQTVLILEMVQGQPIRKTCIPVGAKCLGIHYTNNDLLIMCENQESYDSLSVLHMTTCGEKSKLVYTGVPSTSLYAYMHPSFGNDTSLLRQMFGKMCKKNGTASLIIPIIGPQLCKAVEQNDSNDLSTCSCVYGLRGPAALWTKKDELKWKSLLQLWTETGRQALCMYGDTIYIGESYGCQNRNFITVMKII